MLQTNNIHIVACARGQTSATLSALRTSPATARAKARFILAKASSKGFRLLAAYIFGGNATRQKIAMTAPVTKTATSEKIAMTAPVTLIAGVSDWLVRFTMPARYALADLPVPTNSAVTIKSIPAARFAVLRFSGLAGEAKVATETERLMEFIQSRDMVAVGPSSIARYNPPWTPWFLRRNEVMLPVAAGA